MDLLFKGKTIPLFNLFAIKREMQGATTDLYNHTLDFVRDTQRNGYTGILLPESNAGALNPWFFASLVTGVSSLLPFIAINPVYAHPFFVAKFIANFSRFTQKKMYLNFITGTGLFDAANLGDDNHHDRRYDRLEEYMTITKELLRGTPNYTFKGEFYSVKNLTLAESLPDNLLPEMFVAGNSGPALRVIANTGASRLAMAMTLDDLRALNAHRGYRLGFHFGIIAREDADEARRVLANYCPENSQKRSIQHLATTKSEVVWKKDLMKKSNTLIPEETYNLAPFVNGCSDVPYLIGSYDAVVNALSDYLQEDLDLMVIEVPQTGQDEFHHISNVFSKLSALTADMEPTKVR